MQQKTGYFINYYLDGKPVEVNIINEKELDKHLDNFTQGQNPDFKDQILNLKKEIESRGKK